MDPLKNLKKSINQTVFRDFHYTELQKKKTLAALEDNSDDIEVMILQALHIGSKSGYAILNDLEVSESTIPLLEQEGSLYIILHQLEQRNWIGSTWVKDESGEVKQYYLEKKGKKHLESVERVSMKKRNNTLSLDLDGGLR